MFTLLHELAVDFWTQWRRVLAWCLVISTMSDDKGKDVVRSSTVASVSPREWVCLWTEMKSFKQTKQMDSKFESKNARKGQQCNDIRDPHKDTSEKSIQPRRPKACVTQPWDILAFTVQKLWWSCTVFIWPHGLQFSLLQACVCGGEQEGESKMEELQLDCFHYWFIILLLSWLIICSVKYNNKMKNAHHHPLKSIVTL